MLASAGIGAILAPPVMGAAAFLIAEFLHISYLQVITMAAIPALLYYLSDLSDGRGRLSPSRRCGRSMRHRHARRVTRRGWHYFASLPPSSC